MKRFIVAMKSPGNLAVATLLTVLAAGSVVAGTTGTEFQTLYDLAIGWAQGYLGRALAIIALLVGLGTGMVRGTVLPAIVGIAMAVAFAVGPTVIQGILSAPI